MPYKREYVGATPAPSTMNDKEIRNCLSRIEEVIYLMDCPISELKESEYLVCGDTLTEVLATLKKELCITTADDIYAECVVPHLTNPNREVQ